MVYIMVMVVAAMVAAVMYLNDHMGTCAFIVGFMPFYLGDGMVASILCWFTFSVLVAAFVVTYHMAEDEARRA